MTQLTKILLMGGGAAALILASATASQGSKPAEIRTVSKVEKTAELITPAKDEKKEDDAKDEKWDVNNPPGDKVTVTLDVEEGTWMSLDVSPDGKTIAFDLLGDIYTMPISGGKATNISSGMRWDMQPRFSPDGKRIAFTSDRSGGDNIWTMNVDGSDAKQVTDEKFRLTNNPTWSPDGRFIAAKKHFTTSRSLGTGEIWLYHPDGGSGVQLVKKPSESHQKELGEPMFSPDGRFVYYTQNTTPGSTFIYAQDSNTQLFQIKRYDMETGKITMAAGGAGGAVRPTPSPDGRYLAYVKRVRAKSKLFLKDLKSGEERMIFDHLDQDMQETWAVQGVYPNMDWSPDSNKIYFWANGKIHSVDVSDDNAIEHIDFQVKDTREVRDVPREKNPVFSETFKTQMPRFVQVSPDGKQVVFESLGKIYIRNVYSGEPARLTRLPDGVREAYPSWSRDGKTVSFVSWTDAELGTIYTIGVDNKRLQKVSVEPGHYSWPVLSPDGDFIVYEKGTGGFLTAPEWSNDPGLYIQAVSGGEPNLIRTSGSNPHFGKDDLRIFFTDSKDKSRSLISVNLLGDDERVHASSKLAQNYFMAPDGKSIAFRENYNLYVMPALVGPQNVAAGPKAKALPVTKLSDSGATYPAWSEDGSTLSWSLGPNVYQRAIDSEEDATKIADLSMTIESDTANSMIALTNARIITMSDDKGGVIENGTILIEGNRIAAIGEADSITIGSDYFEVDVDGKTIMPGLIDAHAHGPQAVGQLTPQQNWKDIGHLALGVTTVFDPSNSAAGFFPAAEMQRAGKLLGPRMYSTGEVIYGAKAPGFFADINSPEEAKEHVTRLREQGAYGVKNYNQPRREQRQQVTQAARDHNMLVVPEGGSLYHMDMSLVADGNSSIEHNIPVAEIYDDVVQFMGQTETAYVPTLVVTYGGVRGEDYYYQESDVWKHPILSKHVPPTVLTARAVRRQMAPVEDYADDDAAAVAKKLKDAGVLVTIGAHGQREGLASHWEIWSFERGGMSNVQALQTATVDPAKHLGFYDDIGSLETGKLADLIILDANPLDDIRNTDKIDSVMLGGRLYDAETMNEKVSGDTERLPYWWED